MSKGKVTIVGGGLAGLMAAIKVAEAGVHVDLFSIVPVKRSHSVCAQGGINGAVNTKGEGDSLGSILMIRYMVEILANQPPVKAMCEAAPGIIHLMDRMGVMFNRTPEGLLDFRRFGGTQHTEQLLREQRQVSSYYMHWMNRFVAMKLAGLVTKYEDWEFVSAVIDDEGICRGITAQDLTSMEIHSFNGDAVFWQQVVLVLSLAKSTNSVINTGSAASAVYQQGAYYANGEFIQIHPTAIPGDDKLRLMSESLVVKVDEFGPIKTVNHGIS